MAGFQSWILLVEELPVDLSDHFSLLLRQVSQHAVDPLRPHWGPKQLTHCLGALQPSGLWPVYRRFHSQVVVCSRAGRGSPSS